jgi:hypothetical protein
MEELRMARKALATVALLPMPGRTRAFPVGMTPVQTPEVRRLTQASQDWMAVAS